MHAQPSTITRHHRTRGFVILPWVMCGIGALFYCYEYLLRISPSVMTSELMQTYHINAAALGNLTAYYYYIYAPMQMPVGVLMDRYGPRRLLTVAGLACAVGMYFFASSKHIALAEVGRFLVGFGSAFAFVGVLKLATIWLPPERFGMISGMALSLGMIGGLLGDISLTALVTLEGWKLTSYIAACFGVVLTFVMFLVLRDGSKRSYVKPDDVELPTFKSAFHGLFKIIRNPQIWVNGCIGCLLYLPTSAFAELWGIPYLQDVYHYSPHSAANTISMIFLGWAVGGPLAGWASDRLKQRRLPMTIGAVVATVLISIVLYVPDLPWQTVSAIFFIFGFFSSAQVIVFAVGREISPSRSAGTAIALTNMFVMIGGVLFQPLIGVFLDLSWSGKVINGVAVYAASDYQLALSVLPFGLLVTVFLTFFLRETNGKLLQQ